MVAEMIPQMVEGCEHRCPAIGCEPAGSGKGGPDAEHEVEQVAVLGEDVSENHRVRTVDR